MTSYTQVLLTCRKCASVQLHTCEHEKGDTHCLVTCVRCYPGRMPTTLHPLFITLRMARKLEVRWEDGEFK